MVTIIYSHIVMMELKLIDSLSNDIQYYFKRVFDMKIGYC